MLRFFGALGSGASERSTMKTPLILVIVALLLTACGGGGGGHGRYIPNPTPHKVVMIR
jgi:predicted small secreted protein